MNDSLLPHPPDLPDPPRHADDLDALSPALWQLLLAAEPARAAAWVAAAARLGHAEAQAVLGQWLLDGRGLAPDAAAAMHWFQCAAQQGHPMGMNMLGRCHEQGWGTAADAAKAAHWYTLAAQQNLPEACYNLANLLASGRGVPAVDHTRAVALYRQAADQAYAKAFGKLGRYHEDGLVLAQDAAAARACYERAALGGDFRGQFNLAGLLAAEGRHAEALQWLAQVAAGATPKYLRQVGQALLQSPQPEYQAVARKMLALAGA